MKTLSSLFIAVLASFFLFSCLSQSGNDLKKINDKEKKLAANRQDAKLATELDAAYQTYIQKYPSDTNVPRMLFEDAQIDIFPLYKMDMAIAQLETVFTKYPDNRYAPNALFKSAYLNEKAQRFDKAKSQYLLFVKTYPNHELANQAKELAAMTGLSEEEQFKQIMAKRNRHEDSINNPKKSQ
jgi:outer membrane protein assembly factor BamD (BamD/ComL family)